MAEWIRQFAWIYDQSVNRLAIFLGLVGPRLLLSSCAWVVEPDHDNERDPYGQGWVNPYNGVA